MHFVNTGEIAVVNVIETQMVQLLVNMSKYKSSRMRARTPFAKCMEG